MSLKGGQKNFFEKIKIWFVQIEKISQLVSEGENLTNLENRIFEHDGDLLVKRIAAVGGEYVERSGALLLVPENCFYVLGDNYPVKIMAG